MHPPDDPTPVDLRMMRRALDLARDAAHAGEVPVGAVVYHTPSSRIVAERFNLRHTLRDPAAHAEFLAIREAAFVLGDWRLPDFTLVVTLEPCAMCAGLIVNARLGRLVFGCPDPKAGACGSLFRLTEDSRLNHRITPISGVLARESSELLSSFFRSRRRTPDAPEPSAD